jgi:hypothetical protein
VVTHNAMIDSKDLAPVSPAAQALATWSQQAQGAYSRNSEAAYRADWRSFTG